MLRGERCQGSSMNALRAPLTALSAPLEECRHFLLDRADAFIVGRLIWIFRQLRSWRIPAPFPFSAESPIPLSALSKPKR